MSGSLSYTVTRVRAIFDNNTFLLGDVVSTHPAHEFSGFTREHGTKDNLDGTVGAVAGIEARVHCRGCWVD